MADRGYISSSSSRGSTPSPRSSKSYLEPLSIHKEPKKQQHHTSSYSSRYPDTYLEPPRTTLITPRGESSQSRSSHSRSSGSKSSGRKSELKPLSIHQGKDSYEPRKEIRSDKNEDSRYYAESSVGAGGRDVRQREGPSRKEADSRYYSNSSW